MVNENSPLTIEYLADSARFSFPSTMENIDEVIIEVIDFLYARLAGIKEHAFAINLVLREGLTNAVRHGNAGDPEKTVTLTVDVSEKEQIHIAIEDQGEGFDWKKHQENEISGDEDHGRGMIIMESYFTDFSYNDKGNLLYLVKDISA